METKKCKCCGNELPIGHFRKTRWGGIADTCRECIAKKYRATFDAKKHILHTDGLATYTPRELMEKLARRGYKGKLQYVQVTEIDITNF